MRARPCVSVVVPFFDSERTIAACIESLLAQEGLDEPYEIIAVDNGSADGSAAVLARYDGVTSVEERVRGAYAARNAGIRRAAAPLIAFTDADCAVDRDWLRAILEGMREPSTAILIGHCRYPPDASPALRALGAYENAKAEYVLGSCPTAYHFAYCNNMAVRARVFAELGLFREWPRAADSELVHRLAAHRPDSRTAFRGSMRVTHMEFRAAGARAARLRLYGQTNRRISGFRELGAWRHFAVLLHLLHGGGRSR